MVVETDKETGRVAGQIFVKLKALGYLASTGGDGYTRKRKAVEDRLRALGTLVQRSSR